MKFDWDQHVGSQTPAELFRESGAANADAAAITYLAAVRSGDVFGDPVDLDDDAESDMADMIRDAILAGECN